MLPHSFQNILVVNKNFVNRSAALAAKHEGSAPAKVVSSLSSRRGAAGEDSLQDDLMAAANDAATAALSHAAALV